MRYIAVVLLMPLLVVGCKQTTEKITTVRTEEVVRVKYVPNPPYGTRTTITTNTGRKYTIICNWVIGKTIRLQDDKFYLVEDNKTKTYLYQTNFVINNDNKKCFRTKKKL